MARGRDASDVALTTVFGKHTLAEFLVVTAEVMDNRSSRNPVNSQATRLQGGKAND